MTNKRPTNYDQRVKQFKEGVRTKKLSQHGGVTTGMPASQVISTAQLDMTIEDEDEAGSIFEMKLQPVVVVEEASIMHPQGCGNHDAVINHF